MVLSGSSSRLSRRVLLAVGAISAIGPALLIYLLVFQAPVISGMRLSLAALTIPAFAFPTIRRLSRPESSPIRTLLLSGIGALLFALLGMQVLTLFPEKTYLFQGRHSLAILPYSSDFQLLGIKTAINVVSYRDLGGVESWERQGNKLKPASIPAAPLTWWGWTGDAIFLDVTGPPGTTFEVIRDGQSQVYRMKGDGNAERFEQRFLMPPAGSLLLFLFLWLALWYLLWHFSTSVPSDTRWVSPPAGLRLIFLVLAVLGLGALVIKIYLAIHPTLLFPDRDSGFFMYAGRQILEGKIPYRDFWDHKGPVIYYLDALGLLLGRGSAAGVWALELAWAGSTVACLFVLLRKISSTLAAWVGCLVFLFGLEDALGGGNFVEEYAVLFTILSLLLFQMFIKSGGIKWVVLSGALVGFTFLLRPNQISVGLAIGIYLLVGAVRRKFKRVRSMQVLGFVAGATAPILLFSLYMAGNHAFGEMLNNVIGYNRLYTGPLHLPVLEDFGRGLAGFPWLGFWIIGGLAALLPRVVRRAEPSPEQSFDIVLLLGATAELYLSNISRAGYRHYYIGWLPYAAGLAAYLFSSVLGFLSSFAPRWRAVLSRIIYVVAILAAAGFGWMFLSEALRLYPEVAAHTTPIWERVDHPLTRLRGYSEGYSSLLMWGNEVEFNFLLEKDSPSRFVYQYSLMNPASATERTLHEFIDDLEAGMPLIVDASGGNGDAIPLEPTQRAKFLSLPGNSERYRYLQPLYDFIDANYKAAGSISKNWVVMVPIR